MNKIDELKTFADHPKSKYWSIINKLKPNDIPYSYHKKFWFDCDKCEHKFEKGIRTVSVLNTWCPYCAGKKICENDNCNDCFKKSFASNPKSKFWSDKNKIRPRNVFKGCNEKYFFDCKEHGSFEISPNNISSLNRWCKKCGYESASSKKQLSLEDFINKSKKIHLDNYDYSKVIYNGCDNNVIIICKKHGEFQQTPYNHYTGSGCNKCGIIKSSESKKYSNNDFIEKANNIHNNKYDYSKILYVNSTTKIEIICNIHGSFFQEPTSHLQGCGCKK